MGVTVVVNSTPAAASGTPWVTSTGSFGATRSDFDGCLGVKFTVGGSPITVSSLGRWKRTGNSQTHTVKILQTSTVLASVVVDLSTGSVGSFVYGSITPLVLSASTTYFIVSSETNGGDTWYDIASAVFTETGVAASISACFQSDCLGTPDEAGTSGQMYGFVNFLYS